MTITMTNEILSMNELDRVSGGTNRECKELKKAIPNVQGFFGTRERTESEVKQWLKENLGITATLHDGFFLDPTDDAGYSNLYKLDSTGKYISHEETMAKIKDFLKDK